MIKVRILDRCEYCDGEAYLFVCEDVDSRGVTFDRYRPCEMCHGSGNRAKWVGLLELSNLLERAISMEPDYLELARDKPSSQYRDSLDSAGIYNQSSIYKSERLSISGGRQPGLRERWVSWHD